MADTITVAATGIAGAGVVDPNYTLVSAPVGTTGPGGVPATSAVYGVPAVPAAGSQPTYYQPTVGLFINPSGKGTDSQPFSGPVYDYRTTFSINPIDNLATAILNFTVAADDSVNVYLNGVEVFSGGTYPSIATFTVSTAGDFRKGVNTVDFDVVNSGGGATGLYAVATGSVSATPEPSSMVLLGTGVLAVASLGRRKFLKA
jgi:hypothetical protein